MQRSDIEIFFISSLKHVRKQMEAESKNSGHGNSQSTLAGQPRKEVDVAEMSWTERERVLRTAFSKINNQARATRFLNMPDHLIKSDPNGHTLAPADLMGLTSDAGPTDIV